MMKITATSKSDRRGKADAGNPHARLGEGKVFVRGLCAIGIAFAALAVRAAVPVTDGLIFHVDALDASSLVTNANGVVSEWWSAVGDYTLVPHLLSGTAVTMTAPSCVAERGLPGVRLSHYENGEPVYQALILKDSKSFTARTVFVVNRQIDVCGKNSIGGSIFGGASTYRVRLQRVHTAQYLWNTNSYTSGSDVNNWDAIWVDGTKNKLQFSDVGGTNLAQTIVAVRANPKEAISTFGGSYYSGQLNVGAMPQIVLNKSVMHEVLAYDRVLTDAEIASVSTYLMRRWRLLDETVWTGGGSTTDWHDSANWYGGEVPTCSTIVRFEGNATVTLSGECTASRIEKAGDGAVELTLVNDKDVFLNAEIGAGVSLRKQGAGRLDLCGGQSFAGAVAVESGTLGSAASLPSAYYRSLDGLTFHFDASVRESVETDANDEVLRWRSSAATTAYAPVLLGGSEATFAMTAGKEYQHVNPYFLTNANGYAAVRMGLERDGKTFRPTLLKANTTNGLMTARTFFLVQTQCKASGFGSGILGYGGDYKPYRLMRSTKNAGGSYSAYHFTMEDTGFFTAMNEAWNNGRKALADADCTFEASGVLKPNLLVARNADIKTFEVIGGQYLVPYDQQMNVQYGTFDLHEALFFDTALSDDEIEKISAHLMKKWGVPEQAAMDPVDGLSPQCDFTVATGATVDFGNACTQAVANVSGVGTVRFGGQLDLNGGTFAPGAIAGSGLLTNSSATAATVAFNAPEDATSAIGLAGKVDFVKRGAGELTIRLDRIDGTLRLEGGALKPDFAAYCANLGGLVAHVDASEPATVTCNASGEMTRWEPVRGIGTAFVGGNEATYASWVVARHENPLFLTNANGQAAVRFGRAADRTTERGTVMKYADGQISARTYFLVQTQLGGYGERRGRGLLGNIANYDFRMYQAAANIYHWVMSDQYSEKKSDPLMNEAWVNGHKSASNDDCCFSNSGNAKPNLLVVRNGHVNSFDVIGGQYLQDGTAAKTPNEILQHGTFDLHEMILFDTALGDDEIDRISSYLIKKWGVPPRSDATVGEFANPLPTGTWIVGGNARLNLLGFTQTLGKLVYDADGRTIVPLLTIDGTSLNVTGTDLEFEDAKKVAPGVFLATTGGLTGPFQSVTGAPSNVIYRPKCAKLARGMLVIIR